MEDLWTPYKELVSVVEGYLAHEGSNAPYAVHTFESVLRRHKQTFLSLLKNPPKNNASREEIKRGITEGVTLPSIGRTLLSKELVDEAVIISDMYNVNEYLALELLHTAQSQMVRHPGLGRGLVAVLLYYDGRRALMTALRELAQAAAGVCWSVNVREEITTYVSRYMQQLIADGLLSNILDSLQQMTLDSELAMLQSKRAIPPHKHHLTLRNAIHDTRKLMAGVVFAVSAQNGLSRDIIIRLINEQTSSPSLGPTGALDEISLALQMALLYALDLSVLHSRDDGEELAKTLPLIQDSDLLATLVDQLSAVPNNQSQDNQEKSSGVRALCQLALGLALAALKRAPQSLLRRPDGEIKCELLDQDEILVDAAIDGKVFEYIDEVILSTDLVAKEEYYQRRLHILITDFIVLMHSKLMEMRVKADEAARAYQMYAMEGLTAPTTRTRLHALLRCVERLYGSDPAGLRLEYWRACDHTQQTRSGGRAATLYKFVRLSGELACASLLPAYLCALAALAVPTHAWSLLQARAALSAHHLLTAVRLYRSNLRSEPTAFSNSLHVSALGASAVVTPAARPGKLLVRQEEVEAMIAALKLIESIARQDKDACVQICENPQWDAVNSMFGLICCHVPIQLKAQLLRTLAALGGRALCAARVWQALDAALVLPDRRALSAELVEVETRMEEYPLSRAFLSLLDALCAAAPLPRALGAGARVPGLDPYVDHVLNKLALCAPKRPYVNPAEKWQILSFCFRLFSRWLEHYQPSPSDFPPFGQEAEVNPAPGFRILMQIHTKSELTRLLLDELELAIEVLTTENVSYKKYIEECLISILQILEHALALEKRLSAAAAEAGRSPLLSPLSKLVLVSESPGAACRVAAWCGAAALTAALPAAGAAALALLSRVPLPLAAAAPTPNTRHAFVECLEAEEWGDGEDARNIRRAKEGVLQLIQRCLNSPPPNLAHHLLGYRIDDEISKSALNEPGAAGFPRTCLHSILDILEKHISNTSPDREASDLVESCYRLIYMLCSRPNTSAPLLRFLRSRDHFLPRHLKAVVNLETASVTTISSRSWVLRAAACEAGAARAQLAALLQHAQAQEWEWCVIRRTLEGLRMCVRACAPPKYQLLRGGGLARAINECDLPSGNGGKRINVVRMHALLNRELQAVHANAPQRNLVAQEIQMVLDYVTEVNRERNLAETLTHYYDSWRQLTEIIFCVAPPDLLDIETKKNLLLNILQDLLNKIPPAEVLPQLGNLASGTVLLLLVNLRHCYILQKRESNLKSTEFETTFFGPSNQIMQTKSLTLKFILHKILSWILVAGGSTQKMRVNLYGALLNFLNIVNLKPSPADPEEETNITYVSRLDSSKVKPGREESSLKAMVVDVISGFGDNLSAIVCSDCIGAGHDVCRMVALSCLETLIEINPRTDWMSMLTNQGYLRSLIDSLMQDDEGLKEALEPNPKSLRVLYVYESKMALLIKIASTRVGAETVLAQGALTCLANMKCMDNHPDIHTGYGHHQDTGFVPSVANRFRQILVPALAVCDALLTSLGTQNHACVIHVLNFIIAHIECVDVILRAGHPNSPDGLMIELEAVTSVIARASDRSVLAAAQLESSPPLAEASLQRIQALMLALLARWPAESEHRLYCKIACNLLTYVRHSLATGGERGLAAGGGALAACGGALAACGGALAACGGALAALVPRVLAAARALAAEPPAPPLAHAHTLQELKQLLPEDQQHVSSAAEARAALYAHTRRRACERRAQLAHAAFALQAAARLLWARAAALTCATFENGGRGGGTEEMVEFRKTLVALLNDRTIDQMLEATKGQSSSQTFLELLIKDIKSKVQFSTV